MVCRCSCGLHGELRRLDTTSLSTVQSAEARGSNAEPAYIQEDAEDEEGEFKTHFTLNSPHYSDEDYEDAIAIEREEAGAAITALQLQVHSLRKYKSNYELLCGQLSELNTQIDLQLQRHEADVAALQASIADLQTEKIALKGQVLESQQALKVQRDAAEQDREYSENVHRQLSTAAELLKATDKRLEQQENHFTAEIERLRTQLAIGDDERVEYRSRAKALEEELETFRERESVAKEQEALRRRREKSKHKNELMARAAKIRSLRDELEAHRSTLRATKKQLGQVNADNDTLRKQLTSVKRDGAHLTDIIDSQRFEHESYADELTQTKQARKQLAKRVAVQSQEIDQLQNELADARDELVHKNNKLENYRDEIKTLRINLRQSSQALNEAQCSNDNLVKRVQTLQRAQSGWSPNSKTEESEQRESREHKYRMEILRMRELLVDSQQRATESSKDVESLRRELLGVQTLLNGCKQERHAASEPTNQWDEVLRNSIQPEEI